MEGLDKIGFEVGWDHAEYGVMVPESLYVGTLADGHRAAIQHRGRAKPKEADRYIRKWLQLRRNAWRRERIFADDVTPEFLKQIDVPYCPITRERLTYSTGEDSDWSVDRLINDGGYVRGNLVVMSTGANKAKDALTTKDIVQRATRYDDVQKTFFLDDTPITGLTAAQTMRLYTLILIPHAGEILLSARAFVPPSVPCGSVYVFQCYLTALALLSTLRPDVKAAIKKIEPGMGGINKVIRKITDVGRSPLKEDLIGRSAASTNGTVLLAFDHLMWATEDAWGPNTGVYEAFHEWVWSTPRAKYEMIIERTMKVCRQFGLSGHRRAAPAPTVSSEEFAIHMGLRTGGYIRD